MESPRSPLLARQVVSWGAVWGWLVIFHGITWRAGSSGRQAFAWTMCALALLFGVALFSPALEKVSTWRRQWTETAFCVVLWGTVAQRLYELGYALVRTLKNPQMATTGVDMSLNTDAAATLFLQGLNPYAHKAQLWVTLQPGPHVEVQGVQTLLYGLPYTNGYPYFPMMFFSFMPFRPLAPALNGMRIGICVLFVLSMLGSYLLARRLVPRERVGVVVAIACALLLGLDALYSDEFGNAVPDYVIAVYALYAFVALAHDRPEIAGVLFGLAQACKLLPGPFLVAPALLAVYGTPALRKLLVAYVLTSVIVVGPFVLASPQQFLTSTFLFYIVNHAHGDSSALWYYVTPALRPVFSAIGLLFSGGLVLAAWRVRGRGPLWPMTLSFAAYMVFIAFARMSHVNYVWGIYPLGCVALAIHLARVKPPEACISS